mgnify:CR=1 FL=1
MIYYYKIQLQMIIEKDLPQDMICQIQNLIMEVFIR